MPESRGNGFRKGQKSPRRCQSASRSCLRWSSYRRDEWTSVQTMIRSTMACETSMFWITAAESMKILEWWMWYIPIQKALKRCFYRSPACRPTDFSWVFRYGWPSGFWSRPDRSWNCLWEEDTQLAAWHSSPVFRGSWTCPSRRRPIPWRCLCSLWCCCFSCFISADKGVIILSLRLTPIWWHLC